MSHINRYYDSDFISKGVRAGDHRGLVGGMWDEIGRMQFEYVLAHGLQPGMHFLDIGCGCLRGGLHFIRFLDPQHYYGIDLSQELLDAGFDTELELAGLRAKLKRANLICTPDFDATGFQCEFEMGLALSVFTHLPLDYLTSCLARVSSVMKPGSRFFASVFISPADHDSSTPLLHAPGGVTTYPDQDPFHFRTEQLAECCIGVPWALEKLETWDHPRDQWMAVFVRVPDKS